MIIICPLFLPRFFIGYWILNGARFPSRPFFIFATWRIGNWFHSWVFLSKISLFLWASPALLLFHPEAFTLLSSLTLVVWPSTGGLSGSIWPVLTGNDRLWDWGLVPFDGFMGGGCFTPHPGLFRVYPEFELSISRVYRGVVVDSGYTRVELEASYHIPKL